MAIWLLNHDVFDAMALFLRDIRLRVLFYFI
jgi:hypothetical protein